MSVQKKRRRKVRTKSQTKQCVMGKDEEKSNRRVKLVKMRVSAHVEIEFRKINSIIIINKKSC